MDLWNISKQFDLIATVAFVNEFMGIFKYESIAFVRVQIFEISSDFYTLASAFSPWIMTYRLSCLGTTSFWEEGTLRCEGSEEVLARRKLMGVRIDPTTRRPMPHPENEVAFFKKIAKGQTAAPPRVEFPTTIPDSVRVCSLSIRALPSDTDINRHINQATCLRYCMNCASLAAMRGGFLQKFNRDMAYYNANKFSVEYVGEMRSGDVIDVVCWQDPKDFSILYFHVKNGNKVACRCIGEWHTTTDGSLVEFSQKVIPDSLLATHIDSDRGIASHV